ncbi:MAG TPA: bifunctional oligoribonuclease/PAP phosphatase NrnA [Candidatus Marinimicrobia bacterium]|nr:bifunctional oligoribonuclease/PAP phosphatase NrnA [Candidatus Neomarinimicrobiota bacterium]
MSTEIDKNNRWSAVQEILDGAENIIMSTHMNPDGDGLGSQLAMADYLESKGKKFTILNPSPVPEDLYFLSEYADFRHYDRQTQKHILAAADLAIIFDIGDYNRLGHLGEDLEELGIKLLSIDHHPHQEPNGFSHSVHDVTACATGYLIYDFLKYANGSMETISLEAAEGLYVALMTDTGSFRFNNTDAAAHEMAGELIRFGVRPYELYQQVYESAPMEKVKLLGAVLENIHLSAGGKLAWFIVTREMIKEAGASSTHVGGFTDTVRSVKGVEVAVMLHEIADNKTRLNFRSKGRVKIDDLARQFGGGGHPFAAGAVVRQTMDTTREAIIPATASEIKKQLSEGSQL